MDREEFKHIDNTRIRPGFYLFVFSILSGFFFLLFPLLYSGIANTEISQFNIVSIAVVAFLMIIAIYSEIKQPFSPLSQRKITRYLRLTIFCILSSFIFVLLFLIVQLNKGNSAFEIFKNILEGIGSGGYY